MKKKRFKMTPILFKLKKETKIYKKKKGNRYVYNIKNYKGGKRANFVIFDEIHQDEKMGEFFKELEKNILYGTSEKEPKGLLSALKEKE